MMDRPTQVFCTPKSAITETEDSNVREQVIISSICVSPKWTLNRSLTKYYTLHISSAEHGCFQSGPDADRKQYASV